MLVLKIQHFIPHLFWKEMVSPTLMILSAPARSTLLGIVSLAMAEQENADIVDLKPGVILPVTIEEALADVLIVCLKYGTKVYRGCLLDAGKG